MSLDDLLAIDSPPARIINPPTAAQWAALEQHLGTPLPADYRAYLDRYGTGIWGSYEKADAFFDLAYTMTPGHGPDALDINAIPLMTEMTKTLADLRGRWPEQVPAPVWPEPGGLLYWGGTTTQNGFYWRTQGEPDAWTCMVGDYGCDNWFAWGGNCTSLLAAIATQRVPEWIWEGATRFPLCFRDPTALHGVRLV